MHRSDQSDVQRLLPPVAALISNRIPDRADVRCSEINDVRSISVDWEHWQRRSTWRAIDGKACNVLLKSYRSWIAHHGCTWAVEECVGNVHTMESRWYAKLIGVGLIVEGFVKVEFIAA